MSGQAPRNPHLVESRRSAWAVLSLGLGLAGCAELDGRMRPTVESRVRDLTGRLTPRNLAVDSTAAPVTIEEALPGTLARQAAPSTGIPQELSIADVRGAALAHNLGLEVVFIDPAIAEESVREEEGKFDWVLYAKAARGRQDWPALDDDQGVQTNPPQQRHGWAYEPGVKIPLRTGGVVELSAPFKKKSLDPPPEKETEYRAGLRFSLVQPLLRDGGVGPAVAGIRLARYRRAAVDAKTHLTVLKVLAEADTAYWKVFGAWRLLEVRLQQYELAFDLYELTQKRVAEGLSAEVERIRAQVGVTSRLEDVIVAHTELRLRQRELKRLINLPDLALDDDIALVPTTEPTLLSYTLDRAALVRQALDARMELLEVELQLAADAVNIDLRRNQALPRLDLDYEYTALGRGDSFNNAFEELGSWDRAGWFIGLRGELPATNEQREAALRRAILARIQRLATKADRTQLVEQEVLDALDVLRQNWQRILAARQNVVVAGVNYDAEQRQFAEGLRTMTEVLETLARLGEAQLKEAKAVVDYQIAQVDLAFATGTLLGYSRVGLEPVDFDEYFENAWIRPRAG